MLFSSMIFLWLFLPIVVLSYYFEKDKYRNLLLLLASLIFYSWGEPKYIFLLLFSIVVNYFFGIVISDSVKEKKQKLLLALCIVINLGLLGYFKYFNFIMDNINLVMKGNISTKNIILPLGISFYTFHSLSYVIDIYRAKANKLEVKVQRNFVNLALYFSFFPQLIAGPIIKYHDIQEQLNQVRCIDKRCITYGIKRFTYGLGKKVLISNVMAKVADSIFNSDINSMNSAIAWIGIISYTFQIYYDFSGYSDMAIGLAKIFGFDFKENFNYPYISLSIKEFWRRWHISLSTWFKEYLYIPLGGNRKGRFRTYINLFIVFLTTGIWHGASWNFAIWGIYHGMFIILENWKWGKILENNKFKILNHVYTFLVIMVGWVFFRTESITAALKFIKLLFWPTSSIFVYGIGYYLNSQYIITLVIALLFCGFIQNRWHKVRDILYDKEKTYIYELISIPLILGLCFISLISGTYNPFIYFRF
ncbi:MAG: MBOAT family protein [Lachnospiraceae bacterium]|nr:MBOAT family protein [Lachnospiraceae bacterium]